MNSDKIIIKITDTLKIKPDTIVARVYFSTDAKVPSDATIRCQEFLNSVITSARECSATCRINCSKIRVVSNEKGYMGHTVAIVRVGFDFDSRSLLFNKLASLGMLDIFYEIEDLEPYKDILLSNILEKAGHKKDIVANSLGLDLNNIEFSGLECSDSTESLGLIPVGDNCKYNLSPQDIEEQTVSDTVTVYYKVKNS